MIFTFSILLSIVFLFFSMIHFYWLFGGKWSLEKVIPVKTGGIELNVIPKFATLIVALIFGLFSIIYLMKSELIIVLALNWLSSIFLYIIPTLFFIRAIGDFKYVGIFKKITKTTFAKWDNKLFVPLCFFISFVGFIICFAY